MKKINVLSSLLLLAFAQMDGSATVANPDLLFGLAYQSIVKLQWDVDDAGALHLLDVMNTCIQFDAAQQKALDAAKGSYLYKGVPLDPAKIAAEDKALEDRLKALDHDIKQFMKGGKVGKEVKKVANRRSERKDKQATLKANQDAIAANAAAMTVAQTAQANIQLLRDKNALAFEDALESYIALYGQCYSSGSMWGSSTVIASKHDKNIAITPNEYAQLVATLQSAVAPFGTVTLELSSDQDIHVSISQVLGFLANMKPASNGSWAQFGINLGIGAAIAAGAIVAVNAYSNSTQGKDLLDTSDAQSLLQSLQSQWNSWTNSQQIEALENVAQETLSNDQANANASQLANDQALINQVGNQVNAAGNGPIPLTSQIQQLFYNAFGSSSQS